MKVLAIKTETRDQAEFVLASLHDAVEQKRFELDDMALASKDADGQIDLHKRRSWLHRRTIGGSEVEQSEALIGPGEAVVLARGEDATIDALGARVRALTKGEMKTYDVGPNGAAEVTGTSASIELIDHEGLLRESSDPIPTQTGLLVKAPFS